MASIAEQIRNLSRPEPTNFDPEEDEFDTTRAKLVSQDVGEELDSEKLNSSSLRKKNIALLAEEDSKYHGRPVSRGDVARMRGDFQDSDESLEDDEDDDSVEGDEIESDDDETKEEDREMNDEEDDHDDGDVVDDDDDNDDDEYVDDDDDDDVRNGRGLSDEEEGGGIDSFTLSRKEDEIEKGMAVKQQLSLWDSLLEYRIRIQKAMMLANKLPQSDNVNEFTSSNDINLKSVKDKERKSLMDLLCNLLMVQEKLLEGNPETKSILYPGKKNHKQEGEDDEEIPSDSEEEVEEKESDEEEETEHKTSLKLPSKRKRNMTQEELSECITKRHAAFESYRDSVISKWSEKTRLASGKLSSKSFSAFDKSALTQIKQILNDKPRLIKRTQLKRSSYRVLGKADKEQSTETETEEQANAHLKDYDSEIFDDDDFYHQLLRELIERRTTTKTDDPIEMGRQWLELQKLRRKIKKKIDTKASKGRKLRYNVHSKLVGYMPPIETGTMPYSSRNELFSSLFGQSKTQPEAFDMDVFR